MVTVLTNLILLALELSLQLILLAARAAIIFFSAKYILVYFSLIAAPTWLHYLASSLAIIATSYIYSGMLQLDNNNLSQLPGIGIIASILINIKEIFISLYQSIRYIHKQSYKQKLRALIKLASTILLTAIICITLSSSAYLLCLYCFPYLQIILPGIAPFAKFFIAYSVALTICNFSYKAATSINKPFKIGALFLAGLIVAALYYYHLIPAAQLILIAGSFPAIACIICLGLTIILSPFAKVTTNKAPATPLKGHAVGKETIHRAKGLFQNPEFKKRTRSTSLNSSDEEPQTDKSHNSNDTYEPEYRELASPRNLTNTFDKYYKDEQLEPILKKHDEQISALEQQLAQITQQQEQNKLKALEEQNISKLEKLESDLEKHQAELQQLLEQQKEDISQEQAEQIANHNKIIVELYTSMLETEEQRYQCSLDNIEQEAKNAFAELKTTSEAHISETQGQTDSAEVTKKIIEDAEAQADRIKSSFENKQSTLEKEHFNNLNRLSAKYQPQEIKNFKKIKQQFASTAIAFTAMAKFVSKLKARTNLKKQLKAATLIQKFLRKFKSAKVILNVKTQPNTALKAESFINNESKAPGRSNKKKTRAFRELNPNIETQLQQSHNTTTP